MRRPLRRSSELRVWVPLSLEDNVQLSFTEHRSGSIVLQHIGGHQRDIVTVSIQRAHQLYSASPWELPLRNARSQVGERSRERWCVVLAPYTAHRSLSPQMTPPSTDLEDYPPTNRTSSSGKCSRGPSHRRHSCPVQPTPYMRPEGKGRKIRQVEVTLGRATAETWGVRPLPEYQPTWPFSFADPWCVYAVNMTIVAV